MRGKPAVVFAFGARSRITPAGAGKTTVNNLRQRVNEDHPRRCGENFSSCGGVASIIGSPPQVRGKHEPCGNKAKRAGITPAGAGKTSSSHITCPRYSDHPRRCGENVYILWNNGFRLGSPPQVRGKRIQIISTYGVSRITPAGAGKTSIVITYQC